MHCACVAAGWTPDWTEDACPATAAAFALRSAGPVWPPARADAVLAHQRGLHVGAVRLHHWLGGAVQGQQRAARQQGVAHHRRGHDARCAQRAWGGGGSPASSALLPRRGPARRCPVSHPAARPAYIPRRAPPQCASSTHNRIAPATATPRAGSTHVLQRASDSLVPCTPERCPYATTEWVGAGAARRQALVNRAPFIPVASTSGAISARAPFRVQQLLVQVRVRADGPERPLEGSRLGGLACPRADEARC